jgi:acyl carrier protein
MEDFKERFDKVLTEALSIAREQITPEARFKEDLGADSLDIAELAMELENEFNISIPDEAIDDIKSIEQAEKYVSELLAKHHITF